MSTTAPSRSTTGKAPPRKESVAVSLTKEEQQDEGVPEDPAPPEPESLQIASTALTILAVLLLGFVVQLVFLSRIEHYRSQRLAYANFRNELAQGTAPVGALDNNGKPVKLGEPVALLEIPRIGIREVVGQGTTSGVLMLGPGHRRDTAMPGEAGVSVIMGRRAAYGAPFARLSGLLTGDRISVTTGQGVQQFAVLDVRRAGDDAPAAPGANEGRLVIETATGGAYVPAGVLRVDAKLTSPTQPSNGVTLAASQLPENERVLAGDSSAWLPIVLWAQALLIAAVGIVWARTRWGFWQAWLVGLPVLVLIALYVGDAIIRLLPNVT
jgi:sortase A